MLVITIKKYSFNVLYFIDIDEVKTLNASEVSLNQNAKTIIQGILI